MVQGILPKLVAAAACAIGLARRVGNCTGNLVQEGHNVDGEAAAFLLPAGLPFQEIEPPFAAAVHDDKVA